MKMLLKNLKADQLIKKTAVGINSLLIRCATLIRKTAKGLFSFLHISIKINRFGIKFMTNSTSDYQPSLL